MSDTLVDLRLPALRRFAIAITTLNLLGHTLFGFEQAWIQPLAALSVAYSLELLLEYADAKACQRRPRFAGGLRALADFLLPAHITGLAVAMLLYSGDQVAPIMFAVAVAIGSKAIARAPLAGGGTRHIFNPSNFGITVALLLFPWVSIAPPYHFTESLPGALQWVVPAVILTSGSLLNVRLTHKVPLILAWLCGFVVQAVVRDVLFGTSLLGALVPMSGVAFVLYTFYMVTDPATTPVSRSGQVLFGALVAAVYGLLVSVHIVFGLFFALTLVCALRGIGLYAVARQNLPAAAQLPERLVAAPAGVGVPEP